MGLDSVHSLQVIELAQQLKWYAEAIEAMKEETPSKTLLAERENNLLQMAQSFQDQSRGPLELYRAARLYILETQMRDAVATWP
jgi:hypothetical protein